MEEEEEDAGNLGMPPSTKLKIEDGDHQTSSEAGDFGRSGRGTGWLLLLRKRGGKNELMRHNVSTDWRRMRRGESNEN